MEATRKARRLKPSHPLKAVLVKKYGSVSRFARLAGIEVARVWYAMSENGPATELAEMHRLAAQTPNATLSNELAEADREALKEYIALNHGGKLTHFARTVAGVDYFTVSGVLNGTTQKKTPLVKKLFEAAGLTFARLTTAV